MAKNAFPREDRITEIKTLFDLWRSYYTDTVDHFMETVDEHSFYYAFQRVDDALRYSILVEMLIKDIDVAVENGNDFEAVVKDCYDREHLKLIRNTFADDTTSRCTNLVATAEREACSFFVKGLSRFFEKNLAQPFILGQSHS